MDRTEILKDMGFSDEFIQAVKNRDKETPKKYIRVRKYESFLCPSVYYCSGIKLK